MSLCFVSQQGFLLLFFHLVQIKVHGGVLSSSQDYAYMPQQFVDISIKIQAFTASFGFLQDWPTSLWEPLNALWLAAKAFSQWAGGDGCVPLSLGLGVVSDVIFLTCCPTLSRVDLRSIWSPALSHHISHRQWKHSVPVCRPNTKSLPRRRHRKYTTIVHQESPTRQCRKHAMWSINTH